MKFEISPKDADYAFIVRYTSKHDLLYGGFCTQSCWFLVMAADKEDARHFWDTVYAPLYPGPHNTIQSFSIYPAAPSERFYTGNTHFTDKMRKVFDLRA